MQPTIRVYVNGRGLDIAAGRTVLDAVRLADGSEGDSVATGKRSLTDSRGLPLPADTEVFAGAIIRTVTRRERDG
ncbi:MAG: hypothetical protein ACT4OZ_04870 [Gemmatimonadota bacterium]